MDDSKIRKQDAHIAVGTVASNNVGHYLAWNWVRANWEELKERYASLHNLSIPSTVSNVNYAFYLPGRDFM